MTDLQPLASAAGAVDNEAFAFVQMLAAELSRGPVELPSFPDAAIKVRKVLADDEVSIDSVQKAVGSEAALAARIMQMANSAALNRSGRVVQDLKAAIARIGFNLVRSAALVFAMSQMRKAQQLEPVRHLLQAHWQRSNKVAAFCHLVARKFTTVNPDTALLAGLLHGVGRLYIISRMSKHPKLFANPVAFAGIERDWSEKISTALLKNWGLDGAVLEAIGNHQDLARQHEGPADLSDVLTLAVLLASFHEYPDSLEINLQNVSAVQKMRIDREAIDQMIAESAEELATLQAALSG